MHELVVKLLYSLVAGAFIIGAWITGIQLAQSTHAKQIEELQDENIVIKQNIKQIGEDTSYIRGWVEGQERRR